MTDAVPSASSIMMLRNVHFRNWQAATYRRFQADLATETVKRQPVTI
jgi:hypothetical protein